MPCAPRSTAGNPPSGKKTDLSLLRCAPLNGFGRFLSTGRITGTRPRTGQVLQHYTCKSRSGYFIMLNGACIDWFTRKQTLTALSSCESETYACVLAAACTLHFRAMLAGLFAAQPGSTPVFTDNQATLLNSANDGQSKRSRHFQLRIEFLRDYCRLGRIHIDKVHTDDNMADVLTKPLGRAKFLKFRQLFMGEPSLESTRAPHQD